jgi:hypothetical protein
LQPVIWSKTGTDRKEVYNLEMKIKGGGIRGFLEDNGIELNIFQQSGSGRSAVR